MGEVRLEDIRRALRDVTYPATKDALVGAAGQAGEKAVGKALRSLPVEVLGPKPLAGR